MQAQIHERDSQLEEQRFKLTAMKSQLVKFQRLLAKNQRVVDSRSNALRSPSSDSPSAEGSVPSQDNADTSPGETISGDNSESLDNMSEADTISPAVVEELEAALTTRDEKVRSLEAVVSEQTKLISELRTGLWRIHAHVVGRDSCCPPDASELALMAAIEDSMGMRDIQLKELRSCCSEASLHAQELRAALQDRETRLLLLEERLGEFAGRVQPITPRQISPAPKNQDKLEKESTKKHFVRGDERAVTDLLKEESEQKDATFCRLELAVKLICAMRCPVLKAEAATNRQHSGGQVIAPSFRNQINVPAAHRALVWSNLADPTTKKEVVD